MPAPAPQLELPAPAPTAVWPWVIAVACVCALAFALPSTLQRIEDSLRDAALERVSAAGVVVDVDGRDVELSGELAPDVDRAALVDAVARVQGVRVVRDELMVIDPAARRLEARQRFQESLAGIDTTALAFEPGSAALTDSAEAVLAALADLLEREPEFRVRIAGHTDDTGRPEVNVRLSAERAEAVASRIAAHGIDPARLIATGYGATQPVADNATAAGRARNRRIEISYVD